MDLFLSEVIDVSAREEREQILEMTRVGVANLGARLSHLFIDFLFTVSNGEEEHLEIFQQLRAQLEPRINGEYHRHLVLNKFYVLLEMGEKDLKNKTKQKKLKNKVEEIDSHICPVINSFCIQILSLEAILSAVLMAPVESQHVLLEWFRGLEREQDILMVEIHNRLKAKMSKNVAELWAQFEIYE